MRTTLDPKLQVIARKALVAGLVRYDRTQGWRGPVKRIPLAGEWGAALAKIEIPTDIKPWELAIVLEADRKKAVIGIRPGRLKSGKIAKQRLTGEIAFKQMSWARAAAEEKDGKKGKLGPKPKALSDVLKPGDVIYAAPLEGAKGQWQLMQIPLVEGALVAMDPHTGRVHVNAVYQHDKS